MELHEVFIKNFQDFLQGGEVEATTKVKDDHRTAVVPGERVLAFKDSIAATSTVAVPRDRQDLSIGVEGMVTAVDSRAVAPGRRLLLRVKRVD